MRGSPVGMVVEYGVVLFDEVNGVVTGIVFMRKQKEVTSCLAFVQRRVIVGLH